MHKRRAIIHIGTEKTGTTSIQYVLSRSRTALVEQGFAYSLAAGNKNHLRLAAYAGDSSRVKNLYNTLACKPTSGGPPESFPKDLAAEMVTLPEKVHTVIFSGEHCHSRLVTIESVVKLKALLDQHFSDYTILVYLRRQDELAISSYSTSLRNGQQNARLLPKQDSRTSYFDYAALLDRWASVFGRAAMHPRLFGRKHFIDSDLIRDFLVACGVGTMDVSDLTVVRSPSLVPAAQEFLRRFNALQVHGLRPPRPRWVSKVLNEHFSGPGQKPARDAAREFMRRYEEGNERVRAEYFPDRDRLFSDDFDSYPVEEKPVSDSAVLEVAMAVIEHLSSQPKALLRNSANTRGRPRLPVLSPACQARFGEIQTVGSPRATKPRPYSRQFRVR